MSESNLTKMDVLNFVMLGKKIVVSGAGTVLDMARSKVAELTDSEEAMQRRVAVQVQALIDSGFTQEEARKAINDRIKSRLDRAFENLSKPAGDNAASK